MDIYPTPFADVFIAPSTQSYRIEKACEFSTDQLNSTPLDVNGDTWAEYQGHYQTMVDSLVYICRKEAGWDEFRPHAPGDCAKLLFDQMGLKPLRTSKKSGRGSVDEETLQFFINQGVSIASQIMEARKAQSMLSQLNAWETYAQAGTVQAHWNQCGTPHGRYSCDNPNLQNRIHPIRHTVEAGEGYSFLSLDLGQAEYVVWASLSGDETLAQSFIDGTDFHRTTWDEIHALVPDVQLFDRDERQAGKTINFAVLYLMQDFVLAKRIGCDVATARKILEAHKARAPKASAYIEETLTHARLNKNTIQTYYGRQRVLPDLRSSQKSRRHEANKTAWNHHNSGTAAEILKIKQCRTGAALSKEFGDQKVRLALQMHDELIYRVEDSVLEAAKECALAAFERPIDGFLPFKTDCRTGKTWGDITK